MRRFFISSILLLASLMSAQAQETGLVALETRQDSKGWEGVGRLDIQGKGFCTAALIRDRLILTAAHCLFDQAGNRHPTELFEFRANLRDGRANATRSIVRAIPHPDYDYAPDGTDSTRISRDIAVLELAQPIRTTDTRPYQIARTPRTGAEVGVVSYGRNRESAPSLQEVCSVIGRNNGVLVLTCDVVHGSSGAPVFMVQDGETRIASVISAMAEMDGENIALGTSLNGPLNVILAEYASRGPAQPGGTQRLITTGERNDTGAKFISNN